MKTKILRNIFISVGALLALTPLLSAATLDGALITSKTPLSTGTAPPKIITVDAPGAGTGSGQGTLALAINPAGAIAGYYFDPNPVTHGFVRAPDGIISRLDAPGGGTGPYQGTFVVAINSSGVITGFTRDSTNVYHGFLRAINGTFTMFDVPGAGTGTFQGTEALNINSRGIIAGVYIDSSNVNHGFVRAVNAMDGDNGDFTTFDAPGAGTGPGQGTFVNIIDCLNDAGVTVGWYTDMNNVYHGFVRVPNGTITTIDVRGAGTGPGQGTVCAGINEAGTIEGAYVDSSGVLRGFLRSPNGTFTFIDVPGAGTGPGQGTNPTAINAPAAITGSYIDSSNANHGFVRAVNAMDGDNGDFTTFDAPGAGTGAGQGTTPYCNNPFGAITGYYIDSSNVYHGFLRTP